MSQHQPIPSSSKDDTNVLVHLYGRQPLADREYQAEPMETTETPNFSPASAPAPIIFYHYQC